MCAISFKDGHTRDQFGQLLMQKGIESYGVCATLHHLLIIGLFINSCGPDSLRFRPALIFQPKHAQIALNIFEDALKNYSS